MKINKILLINPPHYVSKEKMDFFPFFPLGIGYLASYLEERGFQIKIVDAFTEGYENKTAYDDKYYRIGLSDKEMLSEISSFSPDIIGISNLFSIQQFALHSMAKVIKDYNKDLKVVVGGPHVSAVPELVMSDNNVDFGVLGEGERTFLELINALNNGGALKDVSGITYRENGVIKVNQDRKFIENLDEIPFPAWHLFKMDKYLNQKYSQGGAVKRHPFMTILTSRGCPLNCFFCSGRDTWGRHIRTRSAENVIKEIKLLHERFGIKELIIVDDNFNFDVDRLNIILDFLIKEKMDLFIDVPSGVFIPKLNKDILRKMKDAGFIRLFFPIESGNEHVLHKIIRKPVDLDKAKELVKYCQEINLEVVGYFILGLPGETKEQMRDTFKLVRELRIEPHFSIATAFPGSDLYKYAEEKGLLKSYDIDQCSDEYNINTSDWTNRELMRFIWFERFKLNPGEILNYHILNPWRLIRGFKRLFS